MAVETQPAQELQRLLLIMEAAGIGTWEWDVQERRVNWCGKSHALLGLPPEVEPCADALLSALHPGESDRLREEVMRAVAESDHFDLEYRVRWPDGSVHWLLAKGQCFRDARGTATAVAGILMDVTQRKHVEEERERTRQETEQQRELLRRLVENAPIGIAVINAHSGCYTLANAKYEANPGVVGVPGCFVGRRLGDFAPPELKKFMHWILQHVVETRQPFSVRQYEVSFGPGRERTWWDNDVVPLLDEHGNVESVLAITNDVTDVVLARKRIEELAAQMQASRDQLETIINSMSEGLVVIEPSGRILSANPAALQLHGVENLAEAPTKLSDYPGMFDIHYPDGRPINREEWPLIRAIQGETVTNFELHGRRLDNGHSWIASYSASPIRDAHGNVSLIIIAIHDLTPVKQAENQLRQLMNELERSNADLEQFAYIASHDLQEPLRMVRGFLDLLRRRLGPELDEESLDLMRFATNGADRMSQLLRGLLLYSRVGTHGRQMEAIGSREALEEARANLRMAEREAEAEILVGDLPTVRADRTQIIQLFQNLIGNALKFRRPDVPLRIQIGAQSENGSWLFWVSDNGIGIPRDQADRVFNVFQRLHSPEQYPGTGVGLAVCRKIVERHGGRIWLESTEGTGSTFYFTLPK